ncbi:MAG: hypothetical protein R2764_17405 [Bacteroidales bacterium]
MVYDPAKTSYECYLSEDQWHLVSAPVANAKSSVYTDIYLKYFTETDSNWTYITSLNYNLTSWKGFLCMGSKLDYRSTKVTYNGSFNTGDQTPPAITYNSGPGMGRRIELNR